MRLYRLLLGLCPASFRNEYGIEMADDIARRRRATRGSGVATFWAITMTDLLRTAIALHLELLRQDLKYSVRQLARTPGFSATALVVLALGIGAATAAISLADFVLIKPLPFSQPDRLVSIWETTPGYDRMEASAPNYRDWKQASSSFASIGAYHQTDLTMAGAEPKRLKGSAVTAGVFPTLGVSPAIGRWFTPEDDREGAAPVIVLSHRLWQTEFGGDPAIVGRSIRFDDGSYAVVGVMPREFLFPFRDVLFWVPARLGGADFVDAERTNNWLETIARLAPGVTLERASAEMAVIASGLRARFPKENKDTGATVVRLGADTPTRARLQLFALTGSALCVLLIACTNLSNLMLVRALARRRELAVRSALGAGRERLVRLLTTEGLVVAVVGGSAGVLVSATLVPLLARLVPVTLPIAESPALDWRALIVAASLTMAAGVLCGAMPALLVGAGRDSSLHALREGPRAGTRGSDRLRSALVLAQMAASVVLLVCLGLLGRALMSVQGIDPGFKPDGVLTMRTELPLPAYDRVATREAYYARVLADVRAQRGVSAAGFGSFVPLSSFRGGIWPVTVTGDINAIDVRRADHVAAIRYVTPGFFDAMGMSIRRGRDIDLGDRQDRQAVAVISESFATRYWPGADPLDRHFVFAGADRRVVGVVGDVRFRGLERTAEPQVYLSSAQVPDGAITFYAPRALVVRTSGEAAALAPSIREIVRRADPGLAVTDVQTLRSLVDAETASRALQVKALAVLSVVALVLAALGVHGLLSFAVSQRTQEFGVRVALGAQPRNILSMVIGHSLALALGGAAVGSGLAFWAGTSLQALLAGVRPSDPAAFGAAAGLVLLATLAGSLVPTIRALRVDPATALRVS